MIALYPSEDLHYIDVTAVNSGPVNIGATVMVSGTFDRVEIKVPKLDNKRKTMSILKHKVKKKANSKAKLSRRKNRKNYK